MKTEQVEWSSADEFGGEGPSLDFIRAIADLLETDPGDILAELGYEHDESLDAVAIEA